jgi:hypothetical protein
MSESKLEIIPFGKYKGQPVDLLAQDPQYCEWLSQQDWFRTRYPAIHTLIINHFGQPEETQEHNALQALFVDEDFRRRFVVHVLGGQDRVRQAALKQKNSQIARHENEIVGLKDKIAGLKDHIERDPKRFSDLAWERKMSEQRISESEKEILKLEHKIRSLQPVHSPEIKTSAEFEMHGLDLMIRYSVTMERLEWSVYRGELGVECKPSVGDDYPAILRQIGAASRHYDCTLILFIGQDGYVGTGATFKQVKTIFKSRNIDIVLQEELR